MILSGHIADFVLQVCDTQQSDSHEFLWKETHFAVAIVTAEYVNSAPVLVRPFNINILEDAGRKGIL